MRERLDHFNGQCIQSIRVVWRLSAILYFLYIFNHNLKVSISILLPFQLVSSVNCNRFNCSAEIAKELPEDSYGLVFGVNTFFAYCLQSILTAIVVTDSFNLHLNIFQQMNVYGGVLAFVGLIYLVLMVISSIRSMR